MVVRVTTYVIKEVTLEKCMHIQCDSLDVHISSGLIKYENLVVPQEGPG